MQNYLFGLRRAAPRPRRLFVEPLEARHLLAGATISGVIWSDVNKNAVHEASEPPVAGVPVYIDLNDNKIQDSGEPTTTTANDGSYSFTGLAAGTYVVRGVIGGQFTQTFPALAQLSPDRLFVADVFANRISELDPVSGAVTHFFTAPYRSGLFMGLAYDGHFLYFASNDNDILFKLNPDTGAVISQSLLPASSIFGMASLNGLLYVDQGQNAPILAFDPNTQTIVKQLNISGVGCCIVRGIGAVKSPDSLLQVTLQSKLVEIDPNSGIGRTTFTEQIFVPNSETSIGQNIYIGDSNGRIDVYSRTGAFVRGFAGGPAVFALAGLAGTVDNAQRVTVGVNQLKVGVDFGTTQPGDFPPMSAADTYGTPFNTSLRIPAPGVLKNDTDADNATLTAIQDTAPLFGTLTFNPDGSFIYVPIGGFRGNDTFTYHTNDGKVSSSSVTVTIEVGPGVTLTESGGSTKVSEDGTADDYSIGLYTTPTGPVQIAVTAGADTLVSSDGSSFFNSVTLTFSDRTPQTVTVKAIDDSIIQGKHTSTIKESVTGTVVDPNYPVSLPIPPVSVSIADDEVPFQNQDNPMDVNNSGVISAADALIIINYINAFGGVLGGFALVKGQDPIPDPNGGGQGKSLFVDVSADNFLAANDALAVINFINGQKTSGGEGEGSDGAALPPVSTDDHAASAANDVSGNLLAMLAVDTATQSKRRT